MHSWRAAQPKTFFSEGIKKLVQRWKKCIEKHRDYVERCYYYKFSVFIEIKFVSVLRLIIDSPTYIHMILFPCIGMWNSLLNIVTFFIPCSTL